VDRRVIGLDGCPDGWVAVELRDGAVSDVAVVGHVADVLDGSHDAVGIDIPVGLLDVPVRDADAHARRVLGRRASTVFSTPPRVVVDLVAADPGVSHAEASALAVAATGAGISIQAFRLLPRIVEVDGAVAAGAAVLEVHPEVAFAHLAGRPLARKTSWAGLEQRRTLLTSAGVHLPADFDGADRCAPDDVLDAAVCALTADLVAGAGDHVTLPPVPTQLDRGRPVVIHAPSPDARGRPVA
jgi:predicted RNase H-like nuclease